MNDYLNQIWGFLSEHYYLTIVHAILGLSLFIFGFINKHRVRKQGWLQIHALASFLQLTYVSIIIYFIPISYQHVISDWLVYTFLIVEAFCVFTFINGNMHAIQLKKIRDCKLNCVKVLK
jgi:uncharacterized membrane protein